MPRTARILIDNVCYHIMSRGNQKQRLFYKDSDYLEYYNILKRYKRRNNAKIYAYCFMPNHIHLIVAIQDKAHLCKMMQGINQAYTKYFNSCYEKVGHLWQGRYKSMIVMKDQYLIDCISYIEHNPVRADLAKTPLEYRWSSYVNRIMGREDEVLDELKGHPSI